MTTLREVLAEALAAVEDGDTAAARELIEQALRMEDA